MGQFEQFLENPGSGMRTEGIKSCERLLILWIAPNYNSLSLIACMKVAKKLSTFTLKSWV